MSETSRGPRPLSTRILGMVPQLQPRLAWLVVVSALITATYVGQSFLIAWVLAHVLVGGQIAELVAPVIGIATLLMLRASLMWYRNKAGVAAAGPVKDELRRRIYAKLLELGPGYLQKERTGEIQATLVDGVETFDGYVGRFLPQSIAAFIGVLGTAGVIVVIDPVIGTTILLCGLVLPILPWTSRKLLVKRSRAWFATYQAMYSDVLDAVQGMVTLKAFNANHRRDRQLQRQAADFCRDSVRLNALTLLYVGVVGLVTATGTALAVGLGVVYRVEGTLTTFELLLILILTRECFRPMQDLQNAYHSGSSAQFASRGIFAILDAETAITAPATPVTLPIRSAPAPVSFCDVEFTYPGRPHPVLDGFNLEIGSAQRVAVVGHSGAGKSTLVALLSRFFDPNSGAIRIGGRDIRELDLDELRALVAVVAQDTYLFHGTVRDNLTLGCPDATAAEIEAAAKASCAHEFIIDLAHGYDAVVGERGLTLSGGQRQRIAIARALLKDAPVLILDEATSSVDGENEAAIQLSLDLLTQGRTTLVIAHRLSTVRSADRIVVLERGRAGEYGTHDELLAASGTYARLVSAQGAIR